jgi:hypothetical protein
MCMFAHLESNSVRWALRWTTLLVDEEMVPWENLRKTVCATTVHTTRAKTLCTSFLLLGVLESVVDIGSFAMAVRRRIPISSQPPLNSDNAIV